MIRIYLISMLTATLIAVIIFLCISLSKPKESFIGDDPPLSGDVLLADNKGSLTTYPLKDLISSIKSSVTELQKQLTATQSDLTSFKDTITKTVSDNLQQANNYTDQQSNALSAQITSELANKQPTGNYLSDGQKIKIQSALPTPGPIPEWPTETWLANGAGIRYKTDKGQWVNPAYLSLDPPQGPHTLDREWFIYYA
jgi:hypothetical protein